MKISDLITNPAKLKETIYGLITILATSIGVFFNAEYITGKQAFSLVGGTAFGLWLACFFADMLAHSITSERGELKEKSHEAFEASLGILRACFVPSLLMLLAFLELISVYKASLWSVILVVLHLIIFILLSRKRQENTLKANILILCFQLVILAFIVFIKIGH